MSSTNMEHYNARHKPQNHTPQTFGPINVDIKLVNFNSLQSNQHQNRGQQRQTIEKYHKTQNDD
jgi:hypothetical protein